jgi:hypothetical protein
VAAVAAVAAVAKGRATAALRSTTATTTSTTTSATTSATAPINPNPARLKFTEIPQICNRVTNLLRWPTNLSL